MLFRNENPNLGPATTLNESGLSGASNSAIVVNDFKPFSREITQIPITATTTTGWAYIAPVKCQIVGVRFVCTTVANSTQTIQLYSMPVASQPAAPTSGNVITAAATPVGSGATANTPAFSALSATTANLILNPGDMIGYNGSAALTSLVGGILQIELVQLS